MIGLKLSAQSCLANHISYSKTEAVAYHLSRGHFNKHSYLSGIVLAEHALHVCTTKTLIFKNCCTFSHSDQVFVCCCLVWFRIFCQVWSGALDALPTAMVELFWIPSSVD